MVKVDSMGRVKIPEDFLRVLRENFGEEVYVTSLNGESVLVYPMKVWIGIENKISSLPSMVPALRKFINFTSYYGKVSKIDGKGRILIHPLLREDAGIDGEVIVIGRINHLEIWNRALLEEDLKKNRFTEQDAEELAKWGL